MLENVTQIYEKFEFQVLILLSNEIIRFEHATNYTIFISYACCKAGSRNILASGSSATTNFQHIPNSYI